MRKIDKTSVLQPSSTLHTQQGFKNNVKNFIQEKNKSSKERKFNGYNSPSIKKVLEKLYSNHTPISTNSSIYNPKCAYCESNSNTVAVLQVEHYRPKKAVEEDFNLRVIQRLVDPKIRQLVSFAHQDYLNGDL